MEIRKQTSVIIKTTDEKTINLGDNVVFNCDNKCFAGTYKGLSKRGALMFESVLVGTEVVFNIMPKSIDSIYLADIDV